MGITVTRRIVTATPDHSLEVRTISSPRSCAYAWACAVPACDYCSLNNSTAMRIGVTQSSLEQIFNGFASQQDEEVSYVKYLMR